MKYVEKTTKTKVNFPCGGFINTTVRVTGTKTKSLNAVRLILKLRNYMVLIIIILTLQILY